MDFFTSTEFCIILLFVAFTIVGMIFSPKTKGRASTNIVPAIVVPTHEAEVAEIEMHAMANGNVKLIHNNFMVRDGETVNIVATMIGDSIRLVEKKGLSAANAELRCKAEAVLMFVGRGKYAFRYESEVSGQWCTFEFANVNGNVKKIKLRY